MGCQNWQVFGQLHETKTWNCLFANMMANLMQTTSLVIFVHFCTGAKPELCYIFATIAKVQMPRLDIFAVSAKLTCFYKFATMAN